MNRIVRPLPLLPLLASALAWSAPPPAEHPSDQPRGQFLGAQSTHYPDWFLSSFLELAEDVDQAAAAGKRIIVLFVQDGCPYCHALVNLNLSQKDIHDYLRAHFDIVLINLWGDREVLAAGGQTYTEKTFAAALNVQFTPTLLFMDENGGIVLRLNGYLPPARFQTALRYVAERREHTQTYTDYLAEHAPPAAAGALNGQPFFRPAPHDLSQRRGQPIAVFFEQRQCPNCDHLHQHVLQDPATREEVARTASIQLDMWSDTPVITPNGDALTARAWAQRLNVQYAPTIVLFNGDGDEVIRSEAFFKTFHTSGLFEYVRTAAYRRQPSFQRWLSARAERWREQGIDVDIWK